MGAKLFLDQYAWDERYRINDAEAIATPALVIYRDEVEHNITATIRVLGGDASRWRPHVKTAKLGYVMRMMVERGVRAMKCATTLELRVAVEAGAEDVLVAYPLVGPAAARVREIASAQRARRISALVENFDQAEQWRDARVGVFVDVNPGMDRTGIEQRCHREIIELVRAIVNAGVEFRGLHYYDGQLGGLEMPQRMEAAHRGYDELLELVRELQAAGIAVEEVITAGTPAFPCSAAYSGFKSAEFKHRVSPGTVIYCDASSLAQLPEDYDYRAAALVMTRVVSHPRDDVMTCDAGHKTVSADAGVPTCVVLGHREFEPVAPSEEHLPLRMLEGGKAVKIGDVLFLLPRHVCPTVNNFDDALMVRGGNIAGMERVTARGREMPLVAQVSKTCV
jgi:D-serine deaminase-like pyridoxal phosphate-dependent protein